MLKANRTERPTIEPLLRRFDESRYVLEHFHRTLLDAISNWAKLKPLVHSIRARIKDRAHLEDKLVRKLRDCVKRGANFEITADNLMTTINDLAGIRLLHLHTAQARDIDQALSEILAKCGYDIVEGPEARTWDIEYEKTFQDMGFQTRRSETLYTSVHYVVSDKIGKTKMTCELQVRTLSEEVWGETDHRLNYPHKASSVACREQIRALARATSASGMLVDAIFATVSEEQKQAKARKKVKAKRPK